MFRKEDLTRKVFFEDLALEWYQTNDTIVNIQEELRNIYEKSLGEIGFIAVNKLLDLIRKCEKLEYYMARDNYSYDSVFEFVSKVEKEEQS